MLYFLWALFFSVTASANLNCASPTVRDVKEVPCMPSVLNQRDTNWCFLFGSHALVQQHVCLAAPKSTAAPKVALRGVIQAYNASFATVDSNLETIPNARVFDWKRPGRSSDVLEAVAKQKTLPLESCAPMADLLSWREKLPVTQEKLTPTEILKVNFERLMNPQNQSERDVPIVNRCDFLSVSATQLSDIPFFANDVYEAAVQAYGDSKVFLNQVFVPKRCEASAVKIPPMKIQKSNPTDAVGIIGLLSAVLVKDRALSFTVCQLKLSGKAECGESHTVVVAGTRKLCCGETCEIEYKVFDSSPGYPVGADGSSWILQDRFVQSALMWSQGKLKSDIIVVENEIRELEGAFSKVMRDSSLSTDDKAQRLAVIRHQIDNRRRNIVNSSSASWIENE
jgi:hypothetical protein